MNLSRGIFNTELWLSIEMAQFRHIKIQPKTIDVNTRLRGINYRVCGVYTPEPRSDDYCFHRLVHFIWHHSENWVFFKTVSFHFQSFKCTLTLQWCENHVHQPTQRPSCSSRNGFWLVYEELSIDFGRTILLQNQDMGWKLGCRLKMSSQLY